MLKKFFDWNIRFCNHIERRLPQKFNVSLLYKHARKTAELCGRQQGQVILDVGGGTKCWYVPHFKEDTSVTIVVMDISEDQLVANEHTTLLAVADATVAIPLRENTADIIVTRSVIEHLRAVEPFLAEAHRVLKAGGVMVNVHPCRYTPFSIINRILPEHIAQKWLYYFFPEWRDACGFKAYYDKCYYTAMRSVIEKSGFSIAATEFRYYQSIYYKFFIPFYLIMLLYDWSIYKMNIRNLSCQMLTVAEKN